MVALFYLATNDAIIPAQPVNEFERRVVRTAHPTVSMNIIEHFFDCPHCGERISMLLDLSVPEQSYIEDCEVCCRPVEICYQAGPDGLSFFSAE